MSQINLQHGTSNSGEQKDQKLKTDMFRSIGKQSRRRKGRLRLERFAEKESFRPGVKQRRGDG